MEGRGNLEVTSGFGKKNLKRKAAIFYAYLGVGQWLYPEEKSLYRHWTYITGILVKR